MGKHRIAVYDFDGTFLKHIDKHVHEFNTGRKKIYGTYYGINYMSGRLKIRGDSSHPNGLYVYLGDFRAHSDELDNIRKQIHTNHVFDIKDVYSIDKKH